MVVVGVLRRHDACGGKAPIDRIAVHDSGIKQPNRLEGAPHDFLDLGGGYIGGRDFGSEHGLFKFVRHGADRQAMGSKTRWPRADPCKGPERLAADGKLHRDGAVAFVVQIAPANGIAVLVDEVGVNRAGIGFGRRPWSK